MGWQQTIAAGGAALLVLLLAGIMNARRGISRASLVPWDYVMILAAILFLAALVQAAMLWRDGWPL